MSSLSEPLASDGPRASEFLMALDAAMLEVLREISAEMQNRFGISKAEAVARLNEAWGHVTFDPYPDIICHELPEHWAYRMYYKDNVPYWRDDADSSTWQIQELPPADSPSWTIPQNRD